MIFKDSVGLYNDFQIFSHRLHWDEHPYVDFLKDEGRTITEQLDDFKKIWFTILFSFSNEHWLTFKTLYDHGQDGLRERFEKHRHARSDLFQIYYPKGTKVPSSERQTNTSLDPLASSMVPPSQAGVSQVIARIEYGSFEILKHPSPATFSSNSPCSIDVGSSGES